MEEAEKFFCISARIYDEFGTYWLRSIGESCMAMIHLEKKEEKEDVYKRQKQGCPP